MATGKIPFPSFFRHLPATALSGPPGYAGFPAWDKLPRMGLILHNTLTRRKEPFTPADPERVTIYVCGPTAYNHAHIGNARPAVVFDVLVGVLRRLYAGVVYARNITDVDDKILAAAGESGESPMDLSRRFADIYRTDMAALGVSPPDLEPLVTEPETMESIRSLIGILVESGNAYEAEGHVLFHVPSHGDYGVLSGRSRDDMIAGARVEVAPYKRDPADFVLWKPSRPDQPGWESPWGRGRPGWHIECSAMIRRHLGETIDIHGGGNDLIFPHHENEIAQSACAHGCDLARVWLHNGFVNVNADKMSKSEGNVILVHDLLKRTPGEVIRLSLLSAHYRQPLEWSDALMERSRRLLDRFYGLMRDVPQEEGDAPESCRAALQDDLNVPQALAALSVLAKERPALLRAAGAWLGLLQSPPEAWFRGGAGEAAVDAAEVERLLSARSRARAARDFAGADRIRDELARMGVTIEDRPDGARWRVSGAGDAG